ncbi:hypothetical protein ABTK75_20425, partial [Acinetobacter baumannii]
QERNLTMNEHIDESAKVETEKNIAQSKAQLAQEKEATHASAQALKQHIDRKAHPHRKKETHHDG